MLFQGSYNIVLMPRYGQATVAVGKSNVLKQTKKESLITKRRQIFYRAAAFDEELFPHKSVCHEQTVTTLHRRLVDFGMRMVLYDTLSVRVSCHRSATPMIKPAVNTSPFRSLLSARIHNIDLARLFTSITGNIW